MFARRACSILSALFAMLVAIPALAQQSEAVGVDEKIGQTIAADQMTFTDEAGQPITLKSLLDRPTILTLVYFRCPGICTPLLNEVARAADQTDLTPGKDYRLITISFDPNEKPEWAALKRKNMLPGGVSPAILPTSAGSPTQ
jgi:protein SCO1/2